MTNDKKRKSFDSVKAMRGIRDLIGSEIAGKTHDELIQWFHDHHYSDPVLERLAIRNRPSGPAAFTAAMNEGAAQETESMP